jgi:hypothetical protein
MPSGIHVPELLAERQDHVMNYVARSLFFRLFAFLLSTGSF